jgi:hypothetical protein
MPRSCNAQRDVSARNPVSVVSANDRRDDSLRGWLAVLCLFLALWQPLNLALVASSVLAALPSRGWPLALLLLARVIVTACGVAAAIAIYHRHSGAAAFAAFALLLSAGAELFVYSTPYFPSNRLPGDTPWYVAWSIATHGAWLAYLFRSDRVRRTLGNDQPAIDAGTGASRGDRAAS